MNIEKLKSLLIACFTSSLLQHMMILAILLSSGFVYTMEENPLTSYVLPKPVKEFFEHYPELEKALCKKPKLEKKQTRTKRLLSCKKYCLKNNL